LPNLTETSAADFGFWCANRQTWRSTKAQIDVRYECAPAEQMKERAKAGRRRIKIWKRKNVKKGKKKHYTNTETKS
jgi:hypothetical protein